MSSAHAFRHQRERVGTEVRGPERMIFDRFPRWGRSVLAVLVFLIPTAIHVGALNVFMLVKLFVIEVLGTAALALWAAWSLNRRRWLPNLRLLWAVLPFVAAVAIATANSQAPLLSLLGSYDRYGGLLSAIAYAAVFVAVAGLFHEQPDRLFGIVKAAAAGSAALAGYVMFQAAGLDWNRWAEEASGEAPASPVGTAGNSNFAGGYLGLTLPFLVFWVMTSKTRAARAVAGAAVGFNLLGLWYTEARGGLVAAAVGMAAMGLFYRHKLPGVVKAASLGAASLVAAVAVLVIWHPGTNRPIGPLSDLKLLRTESLEARWFYWQSAWNVFLDNPVTGTGPDTFYANFTIYRPAEDGRLHPLELADKPHNIVLERAAETGLMGAASYLLVVALALVYGLRAAKRLDEPLRLLLVTFLAVLVAYLGQGMFSIDVPPLASMGWLAIGAIAAIADPGSLVRRSSLKQGSDQKAFSTGRWPNAPAQPARRMAQRLRHPLAGYIAIAVAFLAVVSFASRPLAADLSAADGELGRAIKIHPFEAAYHQFSGRAHQAKAQATGVSAEKARLFDAAYRDFIRALELAPNHPGLLVEIAKLKTLEGETLDPIVLVQADHWWERARDLNPTDVGLKRLIKEATESRRRLAAQFAEVTAARPDGFNGWLNLAKISLALGDERGAFRALLRAEELDPGNVLVKELQSDFF